MAGRYFIRQQTYVCGDYLEAETYPVFQRKGRQRRRCKPTSAIQARLNQRHREMRLTRLVHANFGPEDIALHLTYDQDPDADSAKRNLRNFLRRLARLRKRLGLEPLKYISVTEKGKRRGRVHHHLFLNGGVDRDQIEKLWGYGYANSKRLQFNDEGVTGLSHYVVKDSLYYRAWNSSKNLIQPEPDIQDGKITQRDLREMREAAEEKRERDYYERLYPGYQLVRSEYSKNAINYGDYVYILMRRRS